jgi:hypothetical protein
MDTSSSMAPFFLFHLGSEHCGQTFLFLLPPMVVIHIYFLCCVIEVDHVQHMFMCSVWKQHGSPAVRGAMTPWTRMPATLSVLTASGAATISTELNFQILQSLAPIIRPQPTVDYFSGVDHQSVVQYEQLAHGNHHTTNMLRDYTTPWASCTSLGQGPGCSWCPQ